MWVFWTLLSHCPDLMCCEYQAIFCNCFLKLPVSEVTYKALMLLPTKKKWWFPSWWERIWCGILVHFVMQWGWLFLLILSLLLIIPSTYDQFSFPKVEWHQVKFEVVHGCNEKQPLVTLLCGIEHLYPLVKVNSIKKWILVQHLFSLIPVHATELMHMKPV